AMLEVLREDYVRTARAKGLWPRLVLWRHAARNAMLPVFTVIVLEFTFLIGGLVVTEQVFNLNGLGLLFVESIAHRDHTLPQALVLPVGVITVLAHFAPDSGSAAPSCPGSAGARGRPSPSASPPPSSAPRWGRSSASPERTSAASSTCSSNEWWTSCSPSRSSSWPSRWWRASVTASAP